MTGRRPVRMSFYLEADENFLDEIESEWVPAPGDLISFGKPAGVFEIIKRDWFYPMPGSPSFAAGDGPLVQMMVRETRGMFR